MENYKKELKEAEAHIIELQQIIDEITPDAICWYLLIKSIDEFRSRNHLEESLGHFVSSLEALVVGIRETVNETVENPDD